MNINNVMEYYIMEGFYFIVIVIAIIMLILLLAYIGTQMTGPRTGTDTLFPPVKNTCPDLWTADSTGKCIIPANVNGTAGSTGPFDVNKNIGTLNKLESDGTSIYDPATCVVAGTCINGYSEAIAGTPANIDFNDTTWEAEGKSSDCAKLSWAKTHSIHWDGISNYNQCVE
jgi:hypothetical protein